MAKPKSGAAKKKGKSTKKTTAESLAAESEQVGTDSATSVVNVDDLKTPTGGEKAKGSEQAAVSGSGVKDNEAGTAKAEEAKPEAKKMGQESLVDDAIGAGQVPEKAPMEYGSESATFVQKSEAVASPTDEDVDVHLAERLTQMDLNPDDEKNRIALQVITRNVKYSSDVDANEKEMIVATLMSTFIYMVEEKSSLDQFVFVAKLSFRTLNFDIGKIKPLLNTIQDDLATRMQKLDAHNHPSIAGAGPNSALLDNFYQVDEYTRGNDTFDLERLQLRIDELFHWHVCVREDVDRAKFKYPLLPIIQSSGMGKTKLIHDTMKLSKFGIVSVYKTCIRPFQKDHESDFLNVNGIRNCGSLEEQRNALLQQLGGIVDQCQIGLNKAENPTPKEGENLSETKPRRIILFIDEAHELVRENNGFLLRVLQWFLCHHREEHVVAILAGTNSSLAFHFPDEDERTKSSRLSENANYYNVKPGSRPVLCLPFIELWTAGCLSDSISFPDDTSYSEYERCIPYGRPLFATMIAPRSLPHQSPPPQSGPLMPSEAIDATDHIKEPEHAEILCRILLSKTNDFKENMLSCISILSTRIQLGSTHTSVVSELVAKGYANLTFFERNAHRGLPDIAQFCHNPDPVCARLAMCMMDEEWAIEGSVNTKSAQSSLRIRGLSKVEWVDLLVRALSSGLCEPSSGDIGEIFSALFMLFAGDLLRKQIDAEYCTFSVPLHKWISSMKPIGDVEESPSNISLKVNFIQVCRNCMRNPLRERASEDGLKRLYNSACMSYVYRNHDGIDMLGAAKYTDTNGDRFLGIFVSVKNDMSFADSTLRNHARNVVNSLEKKGIQNGLVLIIRFGGKPPISPMNFTENAPDTPPENPSEEKSADPSHTASSGATDMASDSTDSLPGSGTRSEISSEGKSAGPSNISESKCGKQPADPLSLGLDEATESFVARVFNVFDDEWGLARMIESPITIGTWLSEQYSSHFFLPSKSLSSEVTRSTEGAGRVRPVGTDCTPKADNTNQVITDFCSSRARRNEQLTE